MLFLSRCPKSLFKLAVMLGWLAWLPSAEAHPLGISIAKLTVGVGVTEAQVTMAAEDLESALGRQLYDRDAGQVPAPQLAAALPALRAYMGERLVLRVAGAPCATQPFEVATEGHVVQIRAVWGCGDDADGLVLESRLLAGVDDRFIQIVRVRHGQDVAETVLRDGRSEVALLQPPDRMAVVRDYVLSGIEHIFIGADHVAFLTALLLWATRFWPVVKVVTAFTVAHSITLSLAVLDLVRVPGVIVEPLIALTVIWVAVENFISHDIEGRWRLTFVLGLIHGLGFAGVLQEYGLPTDAIGLALASFNLGVEIGQLAIVALLMPVLLALDRLWPRPHGGIGRPPALVYGISFPVALLGLWWLAERTVL